MGIGDEDSWESVVERVGWEPEFVVLWLQYTRIPKCLWSAPVPIVGLAGDWNLLWHQYREYRGCDLILTDAAGVEVFRREGFERVERANLFGVSRRFVEADWGVVERDIDILFVGNLHPAVQRERMPWLGRVAKLAERRRVFIGQGVFGEEYRGLLNRAKIVFNRSIRGECNMRTFEAAAAGALLFQEAGNLAVPEYFADRQECVYYEDGNLEELLEYYLDHEEERRAIGEAARAKVREYTWEKLWERHLTVIDLHKGVRGQGPGVREERASGTSRLERIQKLIEAGRNEAAVEEARAGLRDLKGEVDSSLLSTVYCLLSTSSFDFLRVEWERAAWQHAGDVAGEIAAKSTLMRSRLHQIVGELRGDLGHLEEAVRLRPDLAVPRMGLGCALGRAGRASEAVEHLREAARANPFDVQAARALYQAMKDSGDEEGCRALATERTLLAKAAPRLVPVEAWFVSPQREQGRAAGEPLACAAGWCRMPIVWEGDHEAVHSLAIANRAICAELERRGHAVVRVASRLNDSPVSSDPCPLTPDPSAAPCPLTPDPLPIRVRHQWPPRWHRPGQGRWVVIQHWEFGSLPASWIGPLSTGVDEVWVASTWVRDCFVKSGVPAGKVFVVPMGVDPGRFAEGRWARGQGAGRRLKTKKAFRFLFVGGSIHRKGIDLLLEAYERAFTSEDDVCLVVKDMGVGTFYEGMTAEGRIAAMRGRAGAPEIEYLDETLTDEDMVELYRACDCLVHPYRGEGFGMPIAEAMASGLPVIVTGYGAALDFCNERNAYLLPGRLVQFAKKAIGDEPTVDYPWLAEPFVDEIVKAMRHVVTHLEEAAAKGIAGREHILANFTWAHTVSAIERRITALHATRPTFSLCMMVKNEEANLPGCLRSVEGLFDDVVVIDTGSTDRTREIAKSFGARVFDFTWVDSFAAARNESLRHATGDWIFWMDADDRLDEENRRKLSALFARLTEEGSEVRGQGSERGPSVPDPCPLAPDPSAFVMTCRCLPNRESGTVTEVQHVRLFRNHPNLRWEHRIHEQILPGLRRLGYAMDFTDIVVHHTGYQDPAVRARKSQRDLRLLEMEFTEQPNHAFTLFNLGMTFVDLKRYSEALAHLKRSLSLSNPDDSIVRKLHYLIVVCHRQLGEMGEAMAACRLGRTQYPEDAELLAQEAILLGQADDFAGAENCYRQLLEHVEGHHFGSTPHGLNGFISRHNLAKLLERQGRLTEAEEQWCLAIDEKPDYAPALISLEEVYLRQTRWPDLEALAQRLERDRSLVADAAVTRARGHLARKEFAIARSLLEAAIDGHPLAFRPRLLLTHVLLQDGTDPSAAKAALLAVLELDPQHEEARRNLAVLRARQAAWV
jgi:glycosyltransferase involved in cell wall biosynthesis